MNKSINIFCNIQHFYLFTVIFNDIFTTLMIF